MAGALGLLIPKSWRQQKTRSLTVRSMFVGPTGTPVRLRRRREMRSVPAWGTLELRGWQAGLVDGSAGMAGGLFVALLLVPLARQKDWRAAAVLGFCCSIAVVLGWQRALYAIPVILGVSVLATSVVRHFSRATESSGATATQSQTESTGETPVPSEQNIGKMPAPPERINLP